MSEIMSKKYYGIKCSIFEEVELFNKIDEWINNNDKKVIFGYNLTMLPKIRKQPEIFEHFEDYDVLLADGQGMYYLLKLFGVPLKSDISTVMFINKLLTIGNKLKYSVLLLGATEENNLKATTNIISNYKNIKVFDGINGYFDITEEEKIVEKINKEKPNILLVGISSPKKENFVKKWRSKLDVNIIILCGGALDVIAGEKMYAPLIIKKIGLSWLFRFFQEPKRLFRPVLVNGLSIIFKLIPKMLYEVKIKKNKNFSILNFYNEN